MKVSALLASGQTSPVGCFWTPDAPRSGEVVHKINGYPIGADRNVLSAGGEVLQLIWDDIDGDQDNELVLQLLHSFEPSEDMLRTAAQFTLTLLNAASTDERLAAAAVKPATRKSVLDHQERSDREQPVVILGRIGHGKSTFLKYLRHVEAKDIFVKKYIKIDLELLAYSTRRLPKCPPLL